MVADVGHVIQKVVQLCEQISAAEARACNSGIPQPALNACSPCLLLRQAGVATAGIEGCSCTQNAGSFYAQKGDRGAVPQSCTWPGHQNPNSLQVAAMLQGADPSTLVLPLSSPHPRPALAPPVSPPDPASRSFSALPPATHTSQLDTTAAAWITDPDPLASSMDVSICTLPDKASRMCDTSRLEYLLQAPASPRQQQAGSAASPGSGSGPAAAAPAAAATTASLPSCLKGGSTAMQPTMQRSSCGLSTPSTPSSETSRQASSGGAISRSTTGGRCPFHVSFGEDQVMPPGHLSSPHDPPTPNHPNHHLSSHNHHHHKHHHHERGCEPPKSQASHAAAAAPSEQQQQQQQQQQRGDWQAGCGLHVGRQHEGISVEAEWEEWKEPAAQPAPASASFYDADLSYEVYSSLGGWDGLGAAVQGMYSRLLEDVRTALFLKAARSHDKLMRHMTQFISCALTGRLMYSEAQLVSWHGAHIANGLGAEHVDIMCAHLADTLASIGAQQHVIDKAIRVLHTYRNVFDGGPRSVGGRVPAMRRSNPTGHLSSPSSPSCKPSFYPSPKPSHQGPEDRPHAAAVRVHSAGGAQAHASGLSVVSYPFSYPVSHTVSYNSAESGQAAGNVPAESACTGSGSETGTAVCVVMRGGTRDNHQRGAEVRTQHHAQTPSEHPAQTPATASAQTPSEHPAQTPATATAQTPREHPAQTLATARTALGAPAANTAAGCVPAAAAAAATAGTPSSGPAAAAAGTPFSGPAVAAAAAQGTYKDLAPGSPRLSSLTSVLGLNGVLRFRWRTAGPAGTKAAKKAPGSP